MLDKSKYFKMFESNDWDNVVITIREDYRMLFIKMLEIKNIEYVKDKSFTYMLGKCIQNYEEISGKLMYLNTVFSDDISVIDKINDLLDIYSYLYKYYKNIET